MCKLLIHGNKEVTGLCQIKRSFSYIFWTTLTDKSEWTFPYAIIANLLLICINIMEKYPSRMWWNVSIPFLFLYHLITFESSFKSNCCNLCREKAVWNLLRNNQYFCGQAIYISEVFRITCSKLWNISYILSKIFIFRINDKADGGAERAKAVEVDWYV